MTAHNIGDRVRSNVDTQLLVKDREYEVVDAIESYMLGSSYVTYVVRDDAGDRFAVCNGHLVLSRA